MEQKNEHADELNEGGEASEEGIVTSDISEIINARRWRNDKKHKDTTNHFLGQAATVDTSIVMPWYYGDLLTWALHQHMERDGWRIVETLGLSDDRPFYRNVNTGMGKVSSFLQNGTMIIENGRDRFVVTVCLDIEKGTCVVVTGIATAKEELDRFANAVKTIARDENIYRGQKIEFQFRIHFLNLAEKMWDDLILDAAQKEDIWANTIGFLSSRERLKQYGIPIKRGILMVGEPGTGKTLACKALMAKASGITCIVSSVDTISESWCIEALYALAEDLSPAIVLIEDIDLIAQEREHRGYMNGSALLTLLSVLDGVEERDGVITIATTNCRETLDKAISKRPSRFDRIIQFEKPSLHHREQLVAAICRRIPLPEDIQRYIALKTDGFTPAQIQEVVYTLAIGHCKNNPGDMPESLVCSLEQVNNAVEKINAKAERPLGFTIANGSNCQRMGTAIPMHNEFTKQDERRQVND